MQARHHGDSGACVTGLYAWLDLRCRATARDSEGPTISQGDLLHGAHLQLRGALRMKDFDRRRVPTRGLEAVLLPEKLKAQLQKVVSHEKVGRAMH